MKIGIASDHRGYELKQEVTKYLEDNGYTVLDYGTTSKNSADYSDYGIILGEKMASGAFDLGIAFCGTGIGISITCNKVKGVRCAKVDNADEARLSREHNDSNIVAISSAKTIEEVKKILIGFLETKFSYEERHQRRISKIHNYEEKEK